MAKNFAPLQTRVPSDNTVAGATLPMLATMSGHPQPRHPLRKTRRLAAVSAQLDRRVHQEALVMWPLLCMISVVYVGLFGRVLGMW
jgi:hypothetical protein